MTKCCFDFDFTFFWSLKIHIVSTCWFVFCAFKGKNRKLFPFKWGLLVLNFLCYFYCRQLCHILTIDIQNSSLISTTVFVCVCVFFFFTALDLSCSRWELVSWSSIKPWPPALGAWSLSHWTTREIPHMCILKQDIWSAE